MPTATPSNLVTNRPSSQGTNFGIANAKKITIKKTRASTPAPLDASTLALAHNSNRVYEDALADKGPSGSTDGITVTVTVETVGAPPAKGDIRTFGGKECKCIDSQTDNSVGELVMGTANYTSDFTPDPTP